MPQNTLFCWKKVMFYFFSSYFKDTLIFCQCIPLYQFSGNCGSFDRALLWLLSGELVYRYLGSVYLGSKVREYTPETHKAKDDMPTMGGIFILITVLFTTLLWADLVIPWFGSSYYVCLGLARSAFGMIGKKLGLVKGFLPGPNL